MSKPLIIQYTGKYANHLLREKEKEIERLKDLIKALWNNNSTSNLNDKQLELLDNIIFDKEKDNE